MKDNVRMLWESVDLISLTVDAWTAENGTGLLGSTIHWVDNKWAYREQVLAIREFVRKHDGENMAAIVIQELDEFGLRSKVYVVTTDNAGGNKRMMALMARKIKIGNPNFTTRRHVPCVAHILNIVIQAAIKNFGVPSAQAVEPNQGNLMRTSEHYDRDQDNDLGDICSPSDDYDRGRWPLCLADVVAGKASEDVPEVEDCNMVILDCPTWWNSTYAMLAAAVKKRDVIDKVSQCFRQKGLASKMSKDEWELVKEFCRILGRFIVSTDHVCKTVMPAICDVVFLNDGLKVHMEEVIQQIEDGQFFAGVRRLWETDCATMAEGCKAMHWKLAEYAEILLVNEAIIIAALMDPFHKGTML
ncbi:putative transcriptional regulator tpeD [Wolffia australiana]